MVLLIFASESASEFLSFDCQGKVMDLSLLKTFQMRWSARCLLSQIEQSHDEVPGPHAGNARNPKHPKCFREPSLGMIH